ncbi:hypothetical protein ABZ567_28950 [Streptomyces sp. NPDC016459]|uniref:hypothetical protein n=1 Tax=Streptomyces sp. NPDC016459 TaxID=3157190 RepID=UPI0033E4EB51
MRLTGGRLDGEHQRGARAPVVVSSLRCPECGSALVRLGSRGDQCEGCRRIKKRDAQQRRKKDAQVKGVTATLRGSSVQGLIKFRVQQATALADSHRKLSLPDSHAHLALRDKHLVAIALREGRIAAVDAQLADRFIAGTHPQTHQPEAAAAETKARRCLLADLAAGRRAILAVLSDPDPLLLRTHAVALLSAVHGWDNLTEAMHEHSISISAGCVPDLVDRIRAAHHTLEGRAVPAVSTSKSQSPEEKTAAGEKRHALIQRLRDGSTTFPQALESPVDRPVLLSVRVQSLAKAFFPDRATRDAFIKKFGGARSLRLDALDTGRLEALVRALAHTAAPPGR